MNAEDRLYKIRTIIHETENALDRINCDHLSTLRSAFLDIILATGPQRSGRRKKVKAKRTSCRQPKTPVGNSESNGAKDDTRQLSLVPKDQGAGS